MIEVDVEYDNGERETLIVEGAEQITMTRNGRIVAIRYDGLPCELEN